MFATYLAAEFEASEYRSRCTVVLTPSKNVVVQQPKLSETLAGYRGPA